MSDYKRDSNGHRLLPLRDMMDRYSDDKDSIQSLYNIPSTQLIIVPEITITVDVKRQTIRVCKVWAAEQEIEEFLLTDQRAKGLRKLWSIPKGRWFLAHITGGVIFKRKGFLKKSPNIIWRGSNSRPEGS